MYGEIRLGAVGALLAGAIIGCGSGTAMMDAGDGAAEAHADEPGSADADVPLTDSDGHIDAHDADTYDGASPKDAMGADVQCWNVYPSAGCGANTPLPSCVRLTGACAIPACSCDGRVIFGCHAYHQPYAYSFSSDSAGPGQLEAVGRPCDPAGCDGGACPLPPPSDGSVDHAPDAGEDAPIAPDGLMPSDATDAGSWTPASLPGIVIWLEADWGIETAAGEAVSLWRDRSGQNNHALQPDVTTAPRLAVAAFGSSPAVRFAYPSWMIVADKLSMRWGQDDIVLLLVQRTVSPCTRCEPVQILFHKSEAIEPWRGPQLQVMAPEGRFRAYITQFQDLRSTGDQDIAAAHVFGMRRTASAIDLRLDGVSAGRLAVTTVTNIDAPGRGAGLGAHGIGASSFQFEGDIAAVIGARGSTSDVDLARLEQYLLAKYVIAGAGSTQGR